MLGFPYGYPTPTPERRRSGLSELSRYAGSPREIMTHNERRLAELSQVYQGWASRETWALHLHLTNDQGLYEEARAIARATHGQEYHADEALKDWVEELRDGPGMDGEAALAMFGDVGSLWRVDWAEVGAALREES